MQLNPNFQQQQQAPWQPQSVQDLWGPGFTEMLGAYLASQAYQDPAYQPQSQQPLQSADQIMSAMLQPTTVGPNGTVTYRGRTSGIPFVGPPPLRPSPAIVPIAPGMGQQQPTGKQKPGAKPAKGTPPPTSGPAPAPAGTPPSFGSVWRPAPWPSHQPGDNGTGVDSTINYGEPGDHTTLNPGNLYPGNVPIDFNVPVTNGPGGYNPWGDPNEPITNGPGGYPGFGSGGGGFSNMDPEQPANSDD